MSDTAWMGRAVCADRDPDIWFDARNRARAQAICSRCPVAEDCRAAWPDTYRGVWGGEVRMATSASNDVADYLRDAKHGTNAGYQMHMREGTPACGRCITAHRFHQIERDGRRSEVAS
ncbi:WhiB family transcriptional regulator [Micrococcus luteus]|uniref:WhiB family transcriptional regulator n=1 Tax=Micrococcus luteus TaxID=1270 RepID=UPI0034468EC7